MSHLKNHRGRGAVACGIRNPELGARHSRLQILNSEFLTRVLRGGSERGTALLETALTLPLILLVSVGIFEFGRAYQMEQVLTNAAREGARVAVLPGSTADDVKSRVVSYLKTGQVPNATTASVTVSPNVPIAIGAGTASGSKVTVDYPFSFMVLNPVARLVVKGATVGAPITMSASAEMRNE
jgi:Flp pilus assembly protein TadG